MPTFGGPDPEGQLLTELQTRAEEAYDRFDQRQPLQPVVSRVCPVCDERVSVADRGHDALGIGMSTETAIELERVYLLHVNDHPLDEVLAVVLRLRHELRESSEAMTEMLKTRIAQAPPQLITQGMPEHMTGPVHPTHANPYGAPSYRPTDGELAHAELDRRDAEERLRRSREQQERYDPVKETPRYSADLPAGTVGIRR